VLRYPGGRGFAAPYRMVHPGAAPAPLAIVGFEAMRLALDTIARLGPRVDLRAGIVRSLRALRRRRSVLGTYGFDPSGDTTLRTIGLYRVSPVSHDPVFNRVLAPPRAL
jgi:ABC-type branched-subunit amino acid transport system substrate-binding protein